MGNRNLNHTFQKKRSININSSGSCSHLELLVVQVTGIGKREWIHLTLHVTAEYVQETTVKIWIFLTDCLQTMPLHHSSLHPCLLLLPPWVTKKWLEIFSIKKVYLEQEKLFDVFLVRSSI